MKKRCKLPIAMVSIYIFLISSTAFLFTGMLIVWVVNDYKLPDGFNINDFYYVVWMGMIRFFLFNNDTDLIGIYKKNKKLNIVQAAFQCDKTPKKQPAHRKRAHQPNSVSNRNMTQVAHRHFAGWCNSREESRLWDKITVMQRRG